MLRRAGVWHWPFALDIARLALFVGHLVYLLLVAKGSSIHH